MKYIQKALEEINRALRGIDIFLILIKSLVLLVVFYLFFFIFEVDTYYAFIPAFVYFVSSIFVEIRIDQVRKLEKKFPRLNEKLITARDYKNRDNVVLDALEQDILQNLKKAPISSFLSLPRTYIMVFLLILSVGSSLYIASQDKRLIDFNEVMRDAVKRFEKQEEERPEEGMFEQKEASIMEVGNERVEVEINPVGMDFDFNDVTEDADYEFSTSFPKDIFISSGASYEEEFTEEQQELIRRYFERKNG
jgi:hypothetical protein